MFLNTLLSYISAMTDENNMRLIVRPTTDQYNRLQKIYETGRYKHLSELLRHIINIGLEHIESKEGNNNACTK